MRAFRIFDPYAFLNDEQQAASTEKTAKALNCDLASAKRLAGLATLAEVPSPDRVPPSANGEYSEGVPGSTDDVPQSGGETVTAAKAANVAKDEVSATVDPTSGCYLADHAQHYNGSASQPEPQLISPASWFERRAPPVPGEPPYDQPCPARRGRVARKDAAFLHFCVTCGAWGAFGYDVFGDRPGRWYCFEHRPSGT